MFSKIMNKCLSTEKPAQTVEPSIFPGIDCHFAALQSQAKQVPEIIRGSLSIPGLNGCLWGIDGGEVAVFSKGTFMKSHIH
jgi:hypothetical protein